MSQRPRIPLPGPPTRGLACKYCQRADQPDVHGNCQGCGAPHPASERLDVTTFASPRPEYIWSPK